MFSYNSGVINAGASTSTPGNHAGASTPEPPTAAAAAPTIKFDNPFGETGAGLTLSAPPTDFSFFTDPSKSFRPTKAPRLDLQAAGQNSTGGPPQASPPGAPGQFQPRPPPGPGPFAPHPPPMPPRGFVPRPPPGPPMRPPGHAPGAQPGGGGRGGRGRGGGGGRGGRGRSGNGGRHNDRQHGGNSGQKGCDGTSLASPAMWADPWAKFKGMYPNCGL